MIRAKFVCTEVVYTESNGKRTSETVRMRPVYSDDPKSENKAWCDATPSGTFEMMINNPAAIGKFEKGKEYYLDFTPAGA